MSGAARPVPELADAALHEAKRGGRNRVQAALGPTAESEPLKTWPEGPGQPGRSRLGPMASRYCVNCGTPLEPRLIEGREQDACPSCEFVLWKDPKVVTLVVVELDGRLVLGRRGIQPGYGRWCLPGGFVNHDEHPQDAAARECLEEICAEVEIVDLLGIYHIPKPAAASMVGIGYRARLGSGAEPAPGSEMLEVAAFDAGSLPELAFPSHGEAVRDWRRIGEYHGLRQS